MKIKSDKSNLMKIDQYLTKKLSLSGPAAVLRKDAWYLQMEQQ